MACFAIAVYLVLSGDNISFQSISIDFLGQMNGSYFPIMIAIYEMLFATIETMKHYAYCEFIASIFSKLFFRSLRLGCVHAYDEG